MAQSGNNSNGFEQTLWATADKLRGTLLPRLMSGQLRVPSQIGSISEIEPIESG